VQIWTANDHGCHVVEVIENGNGNGTGLVVGKGTACPPLQGIWQGFENVIETPFRAVK